MNVFKILTLALLMLSCSTPVFDFDLQGHRGARGLLPENTIPSFLKAIELGVTTLEMDVVISKDGKVVLSHEPWFNHSICQDLQGNEIEDDRTKYNLYNMNYAEIKQFDCGGLGNPRFPDQQKLSVPKPLLSDLILEVEKKVIDSERKPIYNIEIKSNPKGDYIFHPSPETYSDFLYREIESLPVERVCIQSFDFRVLKYWKEKYPEYTLAALIENEKSWQENLKELGFEPSIYSPYFKLLNPDTIDTLHRKGIFVIPWTVNEEKDMLQLLEWGVDGIITDYPDRALKFKK